MSELPVLPGTRPDPSLWPALPQHVKAERDDFENRHGVSYCRRCGVLLEGDRVGAAAGAQRDCKVVTVDLR